MVNDTGNTNHILGMCTFQFRLVHWIDPRSIEHSYACLCGLLLDMHAEDALLARMSYAAYMRAVEARLKAASRLTVRQIVKVALICSFIVSINVKT